MIFKKTMLMLSLMAISSTSFAVTKEQCADLLTREFKNEVGASEALLKVKESLNETVSNYGSYLSETKSCISNAINSSAQLGVSVPGFQDVVQGIAKGVDGVIASQCNQYVGQAKSMVNGTIGKYTGSTSIGNFMGNGNGSGELGGFLRNVGEIKVNSGVR